MFEHADGVAPRREHGYCLDDAARALVVVCREPDAAELDDLREHYLAFVLAAQAPDGRFHNRRQPRPELAGPASVEDCWGRALWGLGTAVARAPHLRARALEAFDRSSGLRSPHRARDGVRRARGGRGARGAARARAGARAADRGRGRGRPTRRRQGVAVARAAAQLRQRRAARGAARRRLRTGVALARRGRPPPARLAARRADPGRPPVRGAGRWPRSGRGRPGFDQQPIEVAALADACARAHRIAGEQRWADGASSPPAWFLGANDSGTPMHDPVSGGGFDGLERAGRNENQGAESTLALLATLQQARTMALLDRQRVRSTMKSVG